MPLAARFSQADIARAMRAITKSQGEWRLIIRPDGAIVIEKGEAGINGQKLSVASNQDYRL